MNFLLLSTPLTFPFLLGPDHKQWASPVLFLLETNEFEDIAKCSITVSGRAKLMAKVAWLENFLSRVCSKKIRNRLLCPLFVALSLRFFMKEVCTSCD